MHQTVQTMSQRALEKRTGIMAWCFLGAPAGGGAEHLCSGSIG
jgi:hypothetical protein